MKKNLICTNLFARDIHTFLCTNKLQRKYRNLQKVQKVQKIHTNTRTKKYTKVQKQRKFLKFIFRIIFILISNSDLNHYQLDRLDVTY